MSNAFSAARLRRSASFHGLAGISVSVFDGMPAQRVGPWDKPPGRKAKSGRPWETGGLADPLPIMPDG